MTGPSMMDHPHYSPETVFINAMSALPLGEHGPLAIAYSGGGDSLALLALACAQFPSRKVHALIVDHGLRPESTKEAILAASQAKALGARPHILRWLQPKGGQSHARKARYALLAEACHEIKATLLLLAHTSDDQEETFALRLDRWSMAHGLAAMSALSPYPLWPEGSDLWLARPLLGIRREALRKWLLARDLSWIDDPSNENPHYARVRVRNKLARLHAAGLPKERLGQSVQLLGQVEHCRREKARALLKTSAQLFPAGYAVVQIPALTTCDTAVCHLALAALLQSMAGHQGHPPTAMTTQKIMALLTQQAVKPFTSAGCRLEKMADTVIISRDPGAVLGRGPAGAGLQVACQKGKTTIFDARFCITSSVDGWIESLGNRAKRLSREERQTLRTLPAAVRPLVPIILSKQDKISSPILGGSGKAVFLGKTIWQRKLAPFWHKAA